MSRPLSVATRPFPSRTRIIATLGPATDDAEVLARVVEAGAQIFRLNFSHGGVDEHLRRIQAVRELERELGKPLAIMGDLPGPKIRVTEVPDGGILVKPGEDVVFERTLDGPCQPAQGDAPVRLACTWEGIVDCVHPGQRVLINDGAVRLLATEVADGSLACRVTAGGLITSHKGVNLPDSELEIEVPTDRDRKMACWAIDHDVDLIAMSFVRAGEEVESLREVMRAHMGPDCGDRPLPIVAKIEVPQAVEQAHGPDPSRHPDRLVPPSRRQPSR